MGFNTIVSAGSDDFVSVAVLNQIHVDGVFVKIVPNSYAPNVVYRVGDGTVHPEGWDNVLNNEYLDFYMPYLNGTGADDYIKAILGAYSANPITRNDGNVLSAGDMYYNTIAKEMLIYNGVAWKKHGVSRTDTVTTLRAMTETPDMIFVTGLSIANDGIFGSNFFKWDSLSTSTDNGSSIIKLDTITTGRYILQFENKVGNINTMTDLLSANYILSPSVNILGYTTANDGGGGLFNYDATVDKATANAGTIIDPSVSLASQGTGVGLGCWVRQYSGAVNVKWFENTQLGYQSAVSIGGDIYFDKGTYTLTDGLIVPSNTTLTFHNEAIISQPNKGNKSAFIINPSTIDVIIDGADIRGAYYGTAPADWDGTTLVATVDGDTWATHLAENIGINIRGRWYQRETLGYDLATMQALTDSCSRITIRNCRIDGFGQSGIFADQIINFTAENNKIFYCGRDGIRMYGCIRSNTNNNTIGNLKPGYDGNYPNWNVYGITATRVFGTSTIPDPNSTIFRPSENVTMDGNYIYNCHTWKSLDTHGGINIKMVNNHCLNSYIGIGADQAGITTTNGINPVRGLVVSNNILESSNATYMRAGMTLYGHDGIDQAVQDVTVTGNILKGYGGCDTDGAISLSNARRVSIVGNQIINPARSGICQALICEDINITGNTIFDPKGYIYASGLVGGSGYTSIPTVTVSSGGATVDAKATASISGGVVTSVSIIHPGEGYTSAPTITITGGGATVDATAVGAFSVGYGVLAQTNTMIGNIDSNSFENKTQATTRAISLTLPLAGYGVKVGNQNTFTGIITKLYPSIANESGGDFGKIAKCGIKALGTGAILSTFGGASIVKSGTGIYDITLPFTALSANNIQTQVSLSASIGMCYATTPTTSTVQIRTYSTAGALADVGFTLFVYNIEG